MIMRTALHFSEHLRDNHEFILATHLVIVMSYSKMISQKAQFLGKSSETTKKSIAKEHYCNRQKSRGQAETSTKERT